MVRIDDRLNAIIRELIGNGITLEQAVEAFEGKYIVAAMSASRGNVTQASKKLGVHRNTLRRTIRALEIDIGPTRAMGRRRPPRSEIPMAPVRRLTLRRFFSPSQWLGILGFMVIVALPSVAMLSKASAATNQKFFAAQVVLRLFSSFMRLRSTTICVARPA